MKLLASLTILGLVMAQSVTAQTNYTKDPESCTSIMVGKKATTDGSVITSHTCDSWYRTWVNMVPAESYERDTVMNIYDGRMHTEFVADQTNVKINGQIPCVKYAAKNRAGKQASACTGRQRRQVDCRSCGRMMGFDFLLVQPQAFIEKKKPRLSRYTWQAMPAFIQT